MGGVKKKKELGESSRGERSLQSHFGGGSTAAGVSILSDVFDSVGMSSTKVGCQDLIEPAADDQVRGLRKRPFCQTTSQTVSENIFHKKKFV